MRLDDARSSAHCLLDAISGSHAYGLNTETSDEDHRGVFVQPQRSFYGLNRIEQLSDEKQDITFFELGRFVELLIKNNPNMLELLVTPPDCVRYRHPLMDLLPLRLFLSKRCFEAFGGYAATQIKKARGLNKKIVTPFPKERKQPSDFCMVLSGQGAVPIMDWLSARGFRQADCGLVAIPHAVQLYGLYHDATGQLGYHGIFSHADTTMLNLSSIPKGTEPVAWVSYNLDGYKTYCRQYLEYWQWVEERNPARYESTAKHGQGYDAKNLMHTFRLLELAREIATEGTLTVRSPSRKRLLKIRRGEFSYETLLADAEAKLAELETLYIKAKLPETPDAEAAELALVEIRQEFYRISLHA
jgi:uncharacterized protein